MVIGDIEFKFHPGRHDYGERQCHGHDAGRLPGNSVTVSYPANSLAPQTLVIPVTMNVSDSALLNITMPLGFRSRSAWHKAPPQITQTITLTSTDPATQVTDISASASSNGPSTWLFLGQNGTSTPQACR